MGEVGEGVTEAAVLTVWISSLARYSFWHSGGGPPKFSLKGFCSAAPSSGAVPFPPTGHEGVEVDGVGLGWWGQKRER